MLSTSVRFLFYLADNRDNQRLDDSIAWWTKWFNRGTPPVSHEEVWIPDNEFGFHYPILSLYTGQCFTSTMRGDVNGTVLRNAATVLTNPERWVYFEVEVSTDLFKLAHILVDDAVVNNKGYDTSAIPSFFWFWRFGSKTKDICSEVCKRFGMWCGVFNNDKIESPRRQYRRFVKMGYKAQKVGK